MPTADDSTGEPVPRPEWLTERQREAVSAALRAGFFERPQRATAGDVAEQLDISRSTFLYHLRNAEQIVFERVLAADTDERGQRASE